MLVSQKSLCCELQNISVCTIVLSFHFLTWWKRKRREWTEKMSVFACLVLLPCSAREKRMWMEWKNVCACTVVLLF